MLSESRLKNAILSRSGVRRRREVSKPVLKALEARWLGVAWRGWEDERSQWLHPAATTTDATMETECQSPHMRRMEQAHIVQSWLRRRLCHLHEISWSVRLESEA